MLEKSGKGPKTKKREESRKKTTKGDTPGALKLLGKGGLQILARERKSKKKPKLPSGVRRERTSENVVFLRKVTERKRNSTVQPKSPKGRIAWAKRGKFLGHVADEKGGERSSYLKRYGKS